MKSKVILYVIIALQFAWLQVGICEVTLSLKLLSFTNKYGLRSNKDCCDNGLTCFSNPCDPQITGCISSKNNKSCDIGQFVTKQYTDQNFILFDNDLGYNVKNPIKMFVKLLTSNVNINLIIEDVDGYKSDLIDNLTLSSHTIFVYPSKVAAIPVVYNSIGKLSSINFTLVAYCSQNYFGSDCNVYCKMERNSKFSCNNNGDKNCHPNWYGKNCQVHCDAKNTANEGYYTCDTNGNKVCRENWYGSNCTIFCQAATSATYTCGLNGEKICEKHHYGISCNVYCNPVLSDGGHYSCQPKTGKKICTQYWYGENCTQYCVATEKSTYTCNYFTGAKQCLKSYYGTQCDIYCKEEPNSNFTCNEVGEKICHKHFYGKDCSVFVPSLPSTEATCIVSGGNFFKTFDDNYFSFSGSCGYKLAGDCIDDTFAIHIVVKNCFENFCENSIMLYASNTVFELKQNHVVMNDYTLAIPSENKGVVIQKISNFLFLSGWQGLSIKWDGSSVYIELSPSYANKTCGLCGNFNGNSKDDQTNQFGTIEKSLSIFTSSWQRIETGEVCSKPKENSFYYSNNIASDSTNSFSALSVDDQLRVKRICSPLQTSSGFLSCHRIVNVNTYYQLCLEDVATCSVQSDVNCSCRAFTQYSRECAQKNVVLNWRNDFLCPKSCPSGMVYMECGSLCEQTCENMHQRSVCPQKCVDGCFCSEDMVKFQSQCIPKAKCPCTHNKKIYNSNEYIMKDCNKCSCASGRWNCTTEDCPATCVTYGDPHYRTFDGKWYDFNGICKYVLTEDYITKHFQVICETVPCNTASDVSCAKSITVVINGSSIELKRSKKVFVDNTLVMIPYTKGNIAIREVSSTFVRLTSTGLEILYDGSATVYVTVDPLFKNKTRGLCGTFNKNSNDDFQTAGGNVERNPLAFGNSWRLDASCGLAVERKHPCIVEPEKEVVADKKCNKLKLAPFTSCHSVVDPTPYIEACRFDVCGCMDGVECLCNAIASYSKACADQGVVISWRNIEVLPECDVSCAVGHVYQECRETCGSTCQDLSSNPHCHHKCVAGCNCPNGMLLNELGSCVPLVECSCSHGGNFYPSGYVVFRDKCEKCTCLQGKFECIRDKSCGSSNCPGDQIWSTSGAECVKTCETLHLPCLNKFSRAGCYCPNDTVWDSTLQKCIDANNCPCHYNGRAYKSGESYSWDCNNCTCRSNQWQCTSNVCPGTCSIYGDPHYTTFDGKRYLFEGDCSYTLVQDSCKTKNGIFKIQASNNACGTSGSTCTKSIMFTFQDTLITLHRDRPFGVSPAPGFNMMTAKYTFIQNHFYDIVHVNIGVTLTWDRGTRLLITLDPKFKGKVCGLCGNFNDNQSDDFTTPELDINVNAEMFGDSWKIGSCPDTKPKAHPCTLRKERAPWSHKQCNIINRDIFKPCHDFVDPRPYFDACYRDACGCDIGGDCECLCTAVAAYAEACNMQGVHIKWRSQEFCPIQCEQCQEYKACGKANPLTCRNLCQPLVSLPFKCVEGCFCTNGTIYHNGKCIKQNLCPCYLNNMAYKPGSLLIQNCQQCVCQDGCFQCSGQTCTTTVFPTTSSTTVTSAPGTTHSSSPSTSTSTTTSTKLSTSTSTSPSTSTSTGPSTSTSTGSSTSTSTDSSTSTSTSSTTTTSPGPSTSTSTGPSTSTSTDPSTSTSTGPSTSTSTGPSTSTLTGPSTSSSTGSSTSTSTGPSTSTSTGPSTGTSTGPSTITSTGPSTSTSTGPSTSTSTGPSSSTSTGPSTSTSTGSSTSTSTSPSTSTSTGSSTSTSTGPLTSTSTGPSSSTSTGPSTSISTGSSTSTSTGPSTSTSTGPSTSTSTGPSTSTSTGPSTSTSTGTETSTTSIGTRSTTSSTNAYTTAASTSTTERAKATSTSKAKSTLPVTSFTAKRTTSTLTSTQSTSTEQSSTQHSTSTKASTTRSFTTTRTSTQNNTQSTPKASSTTAPVTIGSTSSSTQGSTTSSTTDSSTVGTTTKAATTKQSTTFSTHCLLKSGVTGFQCRNSQKFCIEKEKLCDGLFHCPGHDDEKNCPTTRPPATTKAYNITSPTQQTSPRSSTTPWTTKSTTPIPCDGYLCKKENFCIPRRYYCDGEPDCPHDDDENNKDCSLITKQPTVPTTSTITSSTSTSTQGPTSTTQKSTTSTTPIRCTISPFQFFCADKSHCLNSTQVCDKINDCNDHSDENGCPTFCPTSCSKTDFRCHKTCQCLPIVFVCDGQADCKDFSDETGCPPVNRTTQVPSTSTSTSTTEATSTTPTTTLPPCENNKIYKPCLGKCENLCKYILDECVEERQCKQGCGCPKNLVSNGTHCVLRSDCSCFDPVLRQYYKTNTKWERKDDCLECTCFDNDVACHKKACPNLYCPPPKTLFKGPKDCCGRCIEGTFPPTTTIQTTLQTCSSNEFLCRQEHSCIPFEWVCDGERDCYDGEDERSCPVKPLFCLNEIGLYNPRVVPAHAFEASSFRDSIYGPMFIPENARLQLSDWLVQRDSRLVRSGGAWCASHFLYGPHWIQVDLGNIFTITKVGIQSRHNVVAFVEKFKLKYGIVSKYAMQDYYYKGQIKEFDGNRRVNVIAIRKLEHRILARYVRLIIVRYKSFPCLRFELYGCLNQTITTTSLPTTTTTTTQSTTPKTTQSRTTACPEFSCHNRACIANRLICDGKKDCSDGSDEMSCNRTCSDAEFRCSAGHCIPMEFRCDNDPDCYDGSDELDCKPVTCQPTHFRCPKGKCILKKHLCDGDDDCPSGADEKNCPSTTSPPTTTAKVTTYSSTKLTTTTIPPTTAPCLDIACKGSFKCIPQTFICDGYQDCPQGEDESCCKSQEVVCPPLPGQHIEKCIQTRMFCDGLRDCSDGFDEVNCTSTTMPPSTTVSSTLRSTTTRIVTDIRTPGVTTEHQKISTTQKTTDCPLNSTCLCENTCKSISANPTGCLNLRCINECKCPSGYKFNSKTSYCHQIVDCPCNMDGTLYKLGETTDLQNCSRCMCYSDGFKCITTCNITGCSSDEELVFPESGCCRCERKLVCRVDQVITSCACAVTCDNPFNTTCSKSNCEKGCVCPQSTFDDGQSCVSMEQCYCNDRGGVKRLANSEWTSGNCTVCKCKNGKISCGKVCRFSTCPVGFQLATPIDDCCSCVPLPTTTSIPVSRTSRSTIVTTRGTTNAFTTPASQPCKYKIVQERYTDKDNCTSVDMVTKTICQGGCNSSISSDVIWGMGIDKCLCCKPSGVYDEIVNFVCPRGNRKTQSYKRFSACFCQSCDVSPFLDLPLLSQQLP